MGSDKPSYLYIVTDSESTSLPYRTPHGFRRRHIHWRRAVEHLQVGDSG